MKNLHLHCFRLGKYFPDFFQRPIVTIEECLIELFGYTRDDLQDVLTIIQDIQQVEVLRQEPLVPQRSKEWFDLRENRLTASDLAQSLGKGKFGNKKQLLEKKAFPDRFPFKTMAPLKWGTMFEEMGIRCYLQKVNPVKIYEFGLIPNKEIPCFGASPDGITETGIMVEMKCPYNRKCTNEVPEQYYYQIQGQLATCKLSTCDYVECYYEVYHDISEYMITCTPLGKQDHGIILEFLNTSEGYTYEYSPVDYTTEECVHWANRTVATFLEQNPGYTFLKMTPWKLKHMYHTRVRLDRNLWESIVPEIYAFWKEVEALRVQGLPPPVTSTLGSSPSYKRTLTLDVDNTRKYRFIEDSDEEN